MIGSDRPGSSIYHSLPTYIEPYKSKSGHIENPKASRKRTQEGSYAPLLIKTNVPGLKPYSKKVI